jgi:hypothetical protein
MTTSGIDVADSLKATYIAIGTTTEKIGTFQGGRSISEVNKNEIAITLNILAKQIDSIVNLIDIALKKPILTENDQDELCKAKDVMDKTLETLKSARNDKKISDFSEEPSWLRTVWQFFYGPITGTIYVKVESLVEIKKVKQAIDNKVIQVFSEHVPDELKVNKGGKAHKFTIAPTGVQFGKIIHTSWISVQKEQAGIQTLKKYMCSF